MGKASVMDNWIIVLIALLIGEIVGFILARLGDWLLRRKEQKGHWIDDGDPCAWVCNVCGYRVERHNNTPFCPNCGADNAIS